ncbi:TUL4 family lipoprotein, partial [Francisella tularensis subsp. holarctica]|uniref:TUL4 family lipoprotein n=1 Tax=Francisella tularensis TaxID=263 RepID=UPI002381AFB3
IKLKYKALTHEFDARIITNCNGAPQGTIFLSWVEPKDNNCYSTSFPITKFIETIDYTVDSLSLLSDDKFCNGKWTGLIVN